MSTPESPETRLRDALARVVPDAPDAVTDAAPVARAARRRRRSRVVGAVAAAVVAAAVVLPLTLGRGADDGAQVATDPSGGSDADSARVYDGPACPQTLPDPATALPDLSGATQVRLCTEAVGEPRGHSAAEVRASVAADALVEGFDRLGTDLAALPAGDPGRCAAIDYVALSRIALMVTAADGTASFVTGDFCAAVTIGAVDVAAESVVDTFLDALDRQRDVLDYEPTERAPAPLACDTLITSAPTRPGRERIVDAVLCSQDDEPTALTDAQLDDLQTAWAAASPPPTDAPDEDQCDVVDDNRTVAARTDKGDVVRFGRDACGQLTVATTFRPTDNWWVPLTLSDL